jgi:hypothetical protein
MNWLDFILVSLLVAAASAYLVKAFWPKGHNAGCGCSRLDCKVPKAKLSRK